MGQGEGLSLRTVVAIGSPPASAGAEAHSPLHGIAAEVLYARDAAGAQELLARHCPDLVLVLESVSATGGLEVVTALRHTAPATPVVVVAESPSVDQAVRFVRAGAYDYVPGPLDEERLGQLVKGMGRDLARQRQGRYFSAECPLGIPNVGRSQGMVEALQVIRVVSESRCNPVLILGETGTGKELAARAIHAWRCGEEERFVAINCAALTAGLLESELFGHVKGAFTGADRDKTGLFELAGGGTIFLDEISEMPLDLQAKLLRVVQDQTFRKVGGTKDIRCQATIIASSNRNLFAEAEEGRFRRDLYYRLAVFPITIPPLRSPGRRDDILLLAEYFLETSSIPKRREIRGLSESARQKLLEHDWPGNVRELRNVIDRAIILETGQEISPASLIVERPGGTGACAASQPTNPSDFSLETAERQFILRALEETGWQRTRAAALLGITRATLHAKLKRYDIKPPSQARQRPPAEGADSASPPSEKLTPLA